MVIDDRRGEDGRRQRRGHHGPLGQPLGAEEAGPLSGRGVERAEEDEALHPAALRRAQEPDRRQRVQLLDPVRRLVPDRRRQVDDRVDVTKRLAHEVGVGHLAEVAESDLHVDPALAEPPRLAHQAAHVYAALEQQRQQPRSNASGCSGQQQHADMIPKMCLCAWVGATGLPPHRKDDSGESIE